MRPRAVGVVGCLLLCAFLFQGLRAVVLPIGPSGRSVVIAVTLVVAILGVAAVVAIPIALTVLARGQSLDRYEVAAPAEELLLPAPRVPRARGRSPMVAFVSLEPGSGASSLAFNLAVLAAVEGRARPGEDGRSRRPRPLCLLSEGQLTQALGLESDPWRLHLERHTGRVVEDLIEIAVRHPSGCELLCVPRGRVGRHQLRLLRQALDRHYDLVMVDSSTVDDLLREGVEDTADLLLALALPTTRSAAAAAQMLGSGLPLARLATTALVLNQVRVGDRLSEELPRFHNAAVVPYEPALPEADARALPWCLMAPSACGRVLREIAVQLLPDMFTDAAGELPD